MNDDAGAAGVLGAVGDAVDAVWGAGVECYASAKRGGRYVPGQVERVMVMVMVIIDGDGDRGGYAGG